MFMISPNTHDASVFGGRSVQANCIPSATCASANVTELDEGKGW
jgi:hypothetical protein